MAYTIETKDCKGNGATYYKPSQSAVVALLEQLLAHGTKYVGDKINRITITRQSRQS